MRPPHRGPVVGSVAGAWNEGAAVGLELATGGGLGFATMVGPTAGVLSWVTWSGPECHGSQSAVDNRLSTTDAPRRVTRDGPILALASPGTPLRSRKPQPGLQT